MNFSIKTTLLCTLLLSSFTLLAQSDPKSVPKSEPIEKLNYFSTPIKPLKLIEESKKSDLFEIATPGPTIGKTMIPQFPSDKNIITDNGVIHANGTKYHILIKDPNVEAMAKMPIKKVED